MFGVSVYMFFMGGYYDRLVLGKLPQGATLDTYRSAPAGTEMANAYVDARTKAGPDVLNTTLIIPIILIVAFIILNIYMSRRRRANVLATQKV